MQDRTPFQYVIKTLEISKPSKLRFQVRHPDQVFALVGIAVTNTASFFGNPRKSMGNELVGYLSLAIPGKGDVIFGEDVRMPIAENFDLIEQSCSPDLTDRRFSRSGKRRSYFETRYRIREAFMEGFYEDLYLRPTVMNTEVFPYTLRLYLKYQTYSNAC